MLDLKKWILKVTQKIANLYPVGSCYTTSTNSNPGTYLGGTWTLIDKSFSYAWRTNPFTFNTTNTQSGASAIVLHGRTVECRLTWQNKVALSDDTVVIATCNFANNGLNAAQHVTYNVGYADGLNAVGLFHQSWSGATMTVDVFDWVTRATSYPTGTGQVCDLSFTFVVQEHTAMVDSFCNQFVWKRTA